jgi:hypothetical protein
MVKHGFHAGGKRQCQISVTPVDLRPQKPFIRDPYAPMKLPGTPPGHRTTSWREVTVAASSFSLLCLVSRRLSMAAWVAQSHALTRWKKEGVMVLGSFCMCDV